LARVLVVAAFVCASGSAGAGCAPKRVDMKPLPPVTTAKSYPGKAAVDAMRNAIRKLRPRVTQAPSTPGRAAASASRDEQPVGTAGGDVAAGDRTPAASIGHEAAPRVQAGGRAQPRTGTDTSESGGLDPLVVVIVAGWIGLLILLPLAIRATTRR
jgi:hypothetical protein